MIARKKQHNQGFTLFEVIVALVILGLVLGGLFGEVQTQVDMRYRVQERYVAQTVSWNRLLNQYQLLQNWNPPRRNEMAEASGDSEVMGRNWQWELEVQETFGEDFFRYQVDTYGSNDNSNQTAGSLVAYFIAE